MLLPLPPPVNPATFLKYQAFKTHCRVSGPPLALSEPPIFPQDLNHLPSSRCRKNAYQSAPGLLKELGTMGRSLRPQRDNDQTRLPRGYGQAPQNLKEVVKDTYVRGPAHGHTSLSATRHSSSPDGRDLMLPSYQPRQAVGRVARGGARASGEARRATSSASARPRGCGSRGIPRRQRLLLQDEPRGHRPCSSFASAQRCSPGACADSPA